METDVMETDVMETDVMETDVMERKKVTLDFHKALTFR